MKFKILLISATLFCLFSCRPSRETSKYVIETQLLENDTNKYKNFDLLYTNYDRKNKSYLEIASIKEDSTQKFIFSSDVFSNKVYFNWLLISRGQEPFEKYNSVNYFVLSKNEIHSIFNKFEVAIISFNRTDKIVYKSIKIKNDIVFSLEGQFRPFDNRFFTTGIKIWVGKRCNQISLYDFKKMVNYESNIIADAYNENYKYYKEK